MHYMGGKFRIAKHIVDYLELIREAGQTYFEPFVGSANVICQMSGDRIGSDIHKDLILLLKDVRDNAISLPNSMTEEEYRKLKTLPPSAIRGFAGFGCSFAGGWFKGFARSGKGKQGNYCLIAKNSLLRKRPGLQGVELMCVDYKTLSPSDLLIYCDPPYANTANGGKWRGSNHKDKKFNHGEFWEIMRKWSEKNTVVISEYSAPADFKCVLEMQTRTGLRTKLRMKDKRTERLYLLGHKAPYYAPGGLFW